MNSGGFDTPYLFISNKKCNNAKLHTYGFEISSLRLIYDYLTNTKEKININSNWIQRERNTVLYSAGINPWVMYLCEYFYFSEGADIANDADYTNLGVLQKLKSVFSLKD